MKTDIDLPLFNWQPPTCAVIPFPASRRIGRARHVAEILLRKNGNDADAYWRRICSDMSRQMAKAGIPDETIEDEVRAFFEAVHEQCRRIGYAAYRGTTPPGAA